MTIISKDSISYTWSEIILVDLLQTKRGWRSTEPFHLQENLWAEVQALRKMIYEEMKEENHGTKS